MGAHHQPLRSGAQPRPDQVSRGSTTARDDDTHPTPVGRSWTPPPPPLQNICPVPTSYQKVSYLPAARTAAGRRTAATQTPGAPCEPAGPNPRGSRGAATVLLLTWTPAEQTAQCHAVQRKFGSVSVPQEREQTFCREGQESVSARGLCSRGVEKVIHSHGRQ